MRNVVLLLIGLVASCAVADETKPGVLLLRQHGKIVLVAPPQQTSFQVASPEPLFSWEGRTSRATFAAEPDGVTVEFKLDIIGPDWLFVTLAETGRGLSLTIRRSCTGGADHDLISRCYPDYSGLLDDAEFGSLVSALFRRYGQNPLLPDAACLRTTCFGLRPPADPAKDRECRALIGRLADEQWQVREDAMRRLSEARLAPYALSLAGHMDLSPEQRSRIDCVAHRYRIDVDDGLIEPLAAIVLTQDDVAVLAE